MDNINIEKTSSNVTILVETFRFGTLDFFANYTGELFTSTHGKNVQEGDRQPSSCF
jgi:hypothetical protein